MKTNIIIPSQELSVFCQRWQVRELALFGSVLRDDFGPESDIDILIGFDTQARWTLLDFVQMRDELTGIFGREVDLVSRHAVEASQNRFRRKNILESAQVIYAA
jgi:predicted nucleotidyltransferase